MSDKITGALQENLLALLCFSAKSASLIRNAVEPELFSSPLYREIVARVVDFLDRHKAPCGEHLPDLLEDILNRKDQEAELAERLVVSVLQMQGKVNEDYVVAQLEGFIRGQRLKTAVISASELLQEGNLEQAEVELDKGLRSRLQLFSPGLTLAQGWKKAIAGEVRQDVVRTGVKELDAWDLGPGRGEQHLLIGPPKRVKTWWLVNLGKRALLARLRVLHVTLELSEAQIIQRYLQSLFSIMRHKARVEVSRLETDALGRFVSFEREHVKERLGLSDAKAMKAVEAKLDKLRFKENLLVKSFPTGMLTMSGLRAYLDALERAHNFIPDLLIVDYPDLMKVDPKNLRIDLGAVFRDLRGLAVERNLIQAVVTQANRIGAEAKLLTDVHASEDFSKIATADTVITYSQTIAEKELGLARLFVSNTRVSERDRFVVLISQAYSIGQFCLDSALMTDGYWARLTAASSGREADE